MAKRKSWGKAAGRMALKALQGAYNTMPGYVAANTARDVGVSLGRGMVNAGEAAVGLGDLVTGGAVGRGMRGWGYNPEAAKATMSAWYSPAQRDTNQRLAAVDGGELEAAKAMFRPENLNALANTGVEAVPLMLGGAAVGGGLMRLGARSAAGASVLGEGLVNATQAAGQLAQEQADAGNRWNDWDGSLANTGKALGAGFVGGAAGRIGSKATSKLMGGAPDLDTVLLESATRRRLLLPGEREISPRFLRAGGIAGGAVSEAVPEQIVQGGASDVGSVVGGGFGYPVPEKNTKKKPVAP